MPGMINVIGRYPNIPPAHTLKALQSAKSLTIPAVVLSVSLYLRRSLPLSIATVNYSIFTDPRTSTKSYYTALHVLVTLLVAPTR